MTTKQARRLRPDQRVQADVHGGLRDMTVLRVVTELAGVSVVPVIVAAAGDVTYELVPHDVVRQLPALEDLDDEALSAALKGARCTKCRTTSGTFVALTRCWDCDRAGQQPCP